MSPIRLILGCLFALTATQLNAQAGEISPEDSIWIFVSETQIPVADGFADLCMEEPYFGIGTPYYVLTTDKCSGEHDYLYLEDADIREAQAEGLIDPALPVQPIWPDTARSRLSIAWLDLKYMFQSDDGHGDNSEGAGFINAMISSTFADLGLPEPGPGTQFAVVLGLGFLTMRKGAMRVVSALMWIVSRFRSKSAPVGQLRGADAPTPNAKLAQAALDVMATVASANGHFNQSAMAVITQQYTQLTGQAPGSTTLSALFADDKPPVDPAKVGRGFRKPQRIQLLQAAYAVARSDGPLTPPEFGFLKELSQAMKVRMPLPHDQVAAA